MTDREALLAAITAQPAEDVPRLAFADCIQEDEPERAEFIRVQCDLARFRHDGTEGDKDCPTCERMKPLKERERELLDANGQRWLSEAFVALSTPQLPMSFVLAGSVVETAQRQAGLNAEPFQVADFSRGFISTIALSAAAWLAHADAILAAQPVEAVTLTTTPDWYYDGDDVWLIDRFSPEARRRKEGRKCRNATTKTKGDAALGVTFIEAICRAEWQTVKTWHLPPEPTLPHARWAATAATPIADLLAMQDRLRATDRAFSEIGAERARRIGRLATPLRDLLAAGRMTNDEARQFLEGIVGPGLAARFPELMGIA